MKPVKGFEGRYSVDELGRVWSHLSGIYMAPCPSKRGYMYVCLWCPALGKGITKTVHRLVAEAYLGATRADDVDHIDRDVGNNCVGNLRLATKSQNLANSKVRDDNTSGSKGVCFDAKAGTWRARVSVRGRRIHLGRFSTKEEAATAYESAAISNFGEFARFTS